jgi:hypothetical protein
MTPEPSTNGSEPRSLMQGWGWADLLGMPIREHLPKGEVDEHLDRLAKELQPLSESLDEQLATRGDEYTLEERVEALERKVFMLRQANELLFWLAIHRVEKLYESVRNGLHEGAELLRGSGPARRRVVDEDAERLVRRRRMLGQ